MIELSGVGDDLDFANLSVRWNVVIEEITAEAVTVMREQKNHVVRETIPIADIAKVKKVGATNMGKTSKVLIGTAAALGVLFTAAVAAC